MSFLIPVYKYGRLAGHAIVDDDLADDFGSYLWRLSGGYVTRDIRARDTASASMHRQVCDLERGDPRVVHHVNENPLDNRRENLEVCASMSEANCRPHPKRDAAARDGLARYLDSDRRMTRYLLDTRLTEAESTRTTVGTQAAHKQVSQPGFYRFAIRRVGEPGWVFRFPSIRDVAGVLATLNGDVVEVAA